MERLVIPGTPPSVNHMYKNAYDGKRSKRVITEKAQSWIDECIWLGKQWRIRNKWRMASQKVIVRIWFYYPNETRRDTHNALKGMLDALQVAMIYEDDKYALPRIMDYEVDKSNPRIEIEFELFG